MATDKIVQKILEDAKAQAEEIRQASKNETQEKSKQLKDEFRQKKDQMNKEQKLRLKEIEDRISLGTSLEERKLDLGMRREVLDEAFRMAKKRMKDLNEKDWNTIVDGIVLNAVQNDTEYLKVPKKDTKRYQKKLEYINDELRKLGKVELKLDRDPAGFDDGFMLIGRYSDVNASFDVLVDNIKPSLEWDVTEILFGNHAD